MTKTNYTKVESVLEAGLLQLQVNSLLELAAVASGSSEKDKQKPERIAAARKAIANIMKQELNYIYKDTPDIYDMLSLDRTNLFRIFDKPDNISDPDWDLLSTSKELVDAYRAAIKMQVSPEENEKLIESQRKKHINKRFNVNDKWLPLQ
jgi:hypothetical protein